MRVPLCLVELCAQWTVTTDHPLISSFQRYVPRLAASEAPAFGDDGYATDDSDPNEHQQPQSILIPARDGSIIFYGTSGMQKLPHDARRLAEACPVVTDTMHFVGGKRSQLLGIDVRTGVIHRSYHSSSGVRACWPLRPRLRCVVDVCVVSPTSRCATLVRTVARHARSRCCGSGAKTTRCKHTTLTRVRRRRISRSARSCRPASPSPPRLTLTSRAACRRKTPSGLVRSTPRASRLPGQF